MTKDDFTTILYQKNPQMVLGFHGCDKDVAMKVLNSGSEHLEFSKNTYDWLGNGAYFWLNDPLRAYEWAVQAKARKNKIKEPFVIGAVIDLGRCLNLSERWSMTLLQESYESLKTALALTNRKIEDDYINKAPDAGGFNLVRPLDCAVIEHLHNRIGKSEFDTVYGYFQEGEDAFPGGGVKEKSHIQICVRNMDCIKGYFLPRKALVVLND